jgi:hypothetical protein
MIRTTERNFLTELHSSTSEDQAKVQMKIKTLVEDDQRLQDLYPFLSTMLSHVRVEENMMDWDWDAHNKYGSGAEVKETAIAEKQKAEAPVDVEKASEQLVKRPIFSHEYLAQKKKVRRTIPDFGVGK